MDIPDIDTQRALRTQNPFDSRNLIDRFKGMENEAIKALLKYESSDFVLCLSNLIRDINHSSAVRSANAFGVDSVVFTGRRNYDRRGACGTQNYLDIKYIEDYNDAFDLYRSMGYTIVAAEYDEARMQYPLDKYVWSQKSMLVVGEEGRGLESEILDQVDDIVYIKQYGSVRSLNLASAASIFMYDYNSKVLTR